MKLEVLYFAALRERIGMAREACDVPPGVATVADLQRWLAARGAPWSEAFAATTRVRAAVGQTMAQPDTPLANGAEVAFFPPVTGG
jgi:molybdopterin synthase sulfur carrier subunit